MNSIANLIEELSVKTVPLKLLPYFFLDKSDNSPAIAYGVTTEVMSSSFYRDKEDRRICELIHGDLDYNEEFTLERFEAETFEILKSQFKFYNGNEAIYFNEENMKRIRERLKKVMDKFNEYCLHGKDPGLPCNVLKGTLNISIALFGEPGQLADDFTNDDGLLLTEPTRWFFTASATGNRLNNEGQVETFELI